MAPYYGPDEPQSTVQLERFFLAGDVACGVGYGPLPLSLSSRSSSIIEQATGIQLVLFYSCAIYLWNRRKQSRKALFLLAYITLLLSVSTIFLIVQARTVQLMYVDNRNYPGEFTTTLQLALIQLRSIQGDRGHSSSRRRIGR